MMLDLICPISGKTIRLSKLPAVLGRDGSADVQIDDPTLAPYQCMIGNRPGSGLTVWNLRVEFPIEVNGRMVARASLASGDRLQIGETQLVVQYEASESRWRAVA